MDIEYGPCSLHFAADDLGVESIGRRSLDAILCDRFWRRIAELVLVGGLVVREMAAQKFGAATLHEFGIRTVPD